MLQQTPVARVLGPWQTWVERWPSAPALAAAPAGEAVRAWGRLGYPRRALRLHAAATVMTERHDGEVPTAHADLLALPGVGSYTAAAIASFAFGQRHIVLDTNVRRVLTRIATGDCPSAGEPGHRRGAAGPSVPAAVGGTGGPLGGGLDGAGSTDLHGSLAALRQLPRGPALRLAPAGPPGPTRAAAPRSGVCGDRPAMPGRAAGRTPIDRRVGARIRAGPSMATARSTAALSGIAARRRPAGEHRRGPLRPAHVEPPVRPEPRRRTP